MSDPQTNAAFVAPEPEELAPLFPGYEIENLIATGGMGAVYRAVQKSLDRTVAIKILPHELSNDAAFCAGFEAEAKAMARLNHPNLIGVYDFGEVNGMLYIVMEFVPGKSLFHSADGIAIDPGEVIRIVSGICDGLAHAHENGIIHRDIKPSNILLDLSARPKIGDFGLARPIETKVQEGEEIFGTPHYTAPEVIHSPLFVDYRADIFSVGVMLHELLTGRLPADDPRPASVIAHCDPRFDAIIRRATAPLPDNRYGSAAEIAKDLRAINVSAGPRIARPTAPMGHPRPTTSRVRRPVRRTESRKESSSLPGILMFLLAVGIGVYSYKQYQNNKNPHVIVIKESSSDGSQQTPGKPTTPETLPIPDESPISSHNPTTLPHPDPEANSGLHTSKPKPAPETTIVPKQPKFDVPGFFVRARKIMRDRATPFIAARDRNLGENLVQYDREARRLIRKISSRDLRDATEESLKEFIEECKTDGNRIPPSPARHISNVDGIPELHDGFHAKQDAFDATLMQSLFQLSSTYILGLEKQIERLKADDDPAAITLIEEEIKKTRKDEEYFPNLMLGKE